LLTLLRKTTSMPAIIVSYSIAKFTVLLPEVEIQQV